MLNIAPQPHYPDALNRWFAYIQAHDIGKLPELIADDAVFHSPVVFTPQAGKPLVVAYLSAADKVLGNDSFRYERMIVGDDGGQVMLEFALELDGVHINGVDIIAWNEAGLIQDFKVMVRPLQAINKVGEDMGKMLASMKG
jgi:ketosteroid isomerase-like protein